MNFNFEYSASHRIFSVIILLVSLQLMTSQVFAEPYLAIKNKVKCNACHINPIGGGMRTTYGNYYGHNTLPAEASTFSKAEIGKLIDQINIGGNFRYNAEHTEDDAGNNSSTFKVESAQLYLAITPTDSPLTFYLDQQIAPGAAINREAFVMYRFDGLHYIKAGKMYVPFGLRIEDDTSFVRQTTGFNFDSSDNGVELGLDYGQTAYSFFVTNGTGSTSNNDDRFLYGVKAEKLFGSYRVGGTAVYNDSDSESQTLFNLYAGWTWQDITVLSEVDYIVNERQESRDVNQLVGLFEINYQWMQGLNLKFTSEYLDPDIDISDNQESKFSFVTEYAPISNLQLRLGIRIAESIPQLEDRSNEKFFLQTHLYF